MKTAEKLRALRQLMNKHKLAAYLQPVHDEYMNEYPPACNRRVEWLTGFSGSAGMAAVAHTKAAIFVDGRYTLQVDNEIDRNIFTSFNSADTTPESWLSKQLADKSRVGYDPKLFGADSVKRLEKVLAKQQMQLVPAHNLVDDIWDNRPLQPESAVFIHNVQYAGEEAASKRQSIARAIQAAGAEMAVITAPDSVCWLLNIRGRDTENTPLVLAPLLIDSKGKVQLYIKASRCGSSVEKHLGHGVELCDPKSLEKTLTAIGRKKHRVLCDPRSVPVWFTQVLQSAGATIVEAADPCILPKAIKNAVQIRGIKEAHLRDGLALTRLLCWLDRESGRRAITEMEICDRLLGLRAANPLFREPSFNTIAGSGPNGAIVHYRPTPANNRTLRQGELLLLDSGGQYPDGTTDVTRTVPIGEPTKEQKERFTRVLKGHIAIATAQFPEGTTGSQLDSLARLPLWQVGLDYDHGTGHGVGQFLGVHEGPQRISKRAGDPPLRPGMLVSNEPGYYKTDDYGIRIESLVLVVEKQKAEGGKTWFGFDTVTCVPIDTRLVDAILLTSAERQWLNSYHSWVFNQLAPLMNEEEHRWLSDRCAIF